MLKDSRSTWAGITAPPMSLTMEIASDAASLQAPTKIGLRFQFLIQAIHVDLLSENILAVPEGKEILKTSA